MAESSIPASVYYWMARNGLLAPRNASAPSTSATTTTTTTKKAGAGAPEPAPIVFDAAGEARVATVLSVGEECQTEAELRAVLQRAAATGTRPVCYDGFEPSGRMHVAQGLMKALNVNRLTGAGCSFIFWVADWFALLNDKMGGDLDKIRTVGRYMIEVWKACGMDMTHVSFLWSSDEIQKRSSEYWLRVIDIARKNKVSRVVRCAPIMGRAEGDLSAAQIMYPCMQCADIFFLRADICQLGVDQRKVNMLAREYADQAKLPKPIILSHHMLMGLKGEDKMSKSSPDSAIFMEDSEEDVKKKINKAFCPETATGNPLFEYLQYLVFPLHGSFFVPRTAANGGDVTYAQYADVVVAYEAKQLWPGDLKAGLALALNRSIQPVRDHFVHNAEARQLLATMRSKEFAPTR